MRGIWIDYIALLLTIYLPPWRASSRLAAMSPWGSIKQVGLHQRRRLICLFKHCKRKENNLAADLKLSAIGSPSSSKCTYWWDGRYNIVFHY